MKSKQIKKSKFKSNTNKKFKKISLFELQNSPKFLNFKVRAESFLLNNQWLNLIRPLFLYK